VIHMKQANNAQVLRVTTPGSGETHSRVIAELQGFIEYTIKERFRPGRMEYPYPGVDVYNYTISRLLGHDIDIDFSLSDQVWGTLEDMRNAVATSVGIEMWKPLAVVDPGCDDEGQKWVIFRSHNCMCSLYAPGRMRVTSFSVSQTDHVYDLRYMEDNEHTPKMRGTNNE
jgi:hypothetical protein